jgi:hypothetical protein
MPAHQEVPQRRSKSSEPQPFSTEMCIVGDGLIGDKAEQLRQKMPELRKLGWQTPPRWVLAEEAFREFFASVKLPLLSECRQPHPDWSAKIIAATLPAPLAAQVQEILTQLPSDQPVVIRSSAPGDSRGTGAYLSVVVNNRLESVAAAIKQVLASAVSPSALAFQRDAQVSPGMAIMIEPLIAQYWPEEKCWAPPLSGWAVTNNAQGEGSIMMVPGLGCAVSGRNGFKITLEQLADNARDDLMEYVFERRSHMLNMVEPYRSVALFRNEFQSYDRDDYLASAFLPSSSTIEESRLSYDSLSNNYRSIALRTLATLFTNTRQAFSQPQYLEWVMTYQHHRLVPSVVQIADLTVARDAVEIDNRRPHLITAEHAVGNQQVTCSQIVLVSDQEDMANLTRYNSDHANYLLVYPSHLASGGQKHLKYATFDQARVLLESGGNGHNLEPIAHLTGMINMTGKLFGVVSEDNIDQLANRAHDEQGLLVIDGPFTVIASEKYDRLVVYDGDIS